MQVVEKLVSESSKVRFGWFRDMAERVALPQAGNGGIPPDPWEEDRVPPDPGIDRIPIVPPVQPPCLPQLLGFWIWPMGWVRTECHDVASQGVDLSLRDQIVQEG